MSARQERSTASTFLLPFVITWAISYAAGLGLICSLDSRLSTELDPEIGTAVGVWWLFLGLFVACIPAAVSGVFGLYSSRGLARRRLWLLITSGLAMVAVLLAITLVFL